MVNHMQVSPLPPSASLQPPLAAAADLSALFARPDFREGFALGRQVCEEEYADDPEQVPQTEEELVHFVNWELSAQTYQREQRANQIFKDPPISYVHHIGFVLGYLNELMTTRQPSS